MSMAKSPTKIESWPLILHPQVTYGETCSLITFQSEEPSIASERDCDTLKPDTLGFWSHLSPKANKT